jgi:hypothetical protein
MSKLERFAPYTTDAIVHITGCYAGDVDDKVVADLLINFDNRLKALERPKAPFNVGEFVALNDAEGLRAAGLGHLAKDAPSQQCSVCDRKTWDQGSFNRACLMLQPSGYRCRGRFR